MDMLFFMFFKLYKWYKIAQSITNVLTHKKDSFYQAILYGKQRGWVQYKLKAQKNAKNYCRDLAGSSVYPEQKSKKKESQFNATLVTLLLSLNYYLQDKKYMCLGLHAQKVTVGRYFIIVIFLSLFFFYAKSTGNTEAKSSQISIH